MKLFVLTGAGCSAERCLGTFRDRNGLWKRFDPLSLPRRRLSRAILTRCTPSTICAAATCYPPRPTPPMPRWSVWKPGSGRKATSCSSVRRTSTISMNAPVCGRLRTCTANCSRCDACVAKLLCRGLTISAGRTPTHPAALSLPCALMSSGSEKRRFTWTTSYHALYRADMFVAIGTSGAVYPAASFVNEARRMGIRTCEINLESSDNANVFDETLYDPATEVVPLWIELILCM